MDNLLKKTITITAIDQKPDSFKIVDQDNQSYYLSITKKDGTITRIYSDWQKMELKINSTIIVNYQEITSKAGHKYNSARFFEIPTDQDKITVPPFITPKEVMAVKQETDNKIKSNIRWCNAINNSCLLVANDKLLKDRVDINLAIEKMANWIYKLEPICENEENARIDEEMTTSVSEEAPDIRIDEISF